MKQLLLLAALAAIPVVAFSADPPVTDQQVAALNPVTVTATRTPVPESDALAATVVIDRREIERSQATDVAGILQQYAGLEISRSGGPGQPASLFVRGGNSNYTVLLIDGVRIDDATSGAPPLADISPEMIERIEVIEGPRAALYGADALGGVVNIITRQPGPAALDVSLGGGSFDTASAGAALRDQGMVGGHAWGAVFDVQQQHSGGFPTFQGATQASAYRNRTLNGRGTLALGPVSLEVRAWDTRGNTQYLNTNFDSPPPDYSPVFTGFSAAASNFHDQILALKARTRLTTAWQSSLTFSRSLYQLDQAQADPGTTQAGFARVIRPELDWHNVLGVDAHNRLSFGARADRERVDALTYGSRYAQVRDRDYAYLQDEADYGRHHGVAAVNYLHDGQFGERFDWNAEYGYDVLRNTRLVLGAGTAFRAPTASDLYYPGSSNPHLQPEKALNVEVALRQQITPAQSAQLRLFRSDVRDYIAYDSSFTPQNIQSVRLEGLQATWRYVDEHWDARVDGIWQDPRNRSLDQRLLRRARLIGSVQVTHNFGRYSVGATLYSSSQRPDIGGLSFAPTTDGGYALFGLNAGVRLTSRLRLNARWQNALNHHYQTVNGYNQPGSAIYATLRYAMSL